jgi:hypothetical protein
MIAIDPSTGDYIIDEEFIDRRQHRSWIKIVLNHYCMAIWNGSHKGVWHLYGHSHAGAEAWMDKHMPGRRAFDVGIDNAYKVLGEYRPWNLLDDIKPIMDTRSGFSMDHHRG